MDLDNFAYVRLTKFYNWVSSKLSANINFQRQTIMRIDNYILPVFERAVVENHKFVTKYSTIPDINVLDTLDALVPSSVVDAYAMLAVYAEFNRSDTKTATNSNGETIEVLVPKSVEMPVGIIEKFKEAI